MTTDMLQGDTQRSVIDYMEPACFLVAPLWSCFSFRQAECLGYPLTYAAGRHYFMPSTPWNPSVSVAL